MHSSTPTNSGEFSNVPSTAVAIDADKNSQQAVKWTVDNLLLTTQSVTLIHVRLKNNQSGYGAPMGFSVTEQSSEASKEQIDQEMQQLFLPYKGFCARKGILMKEVVLEDTDVSKGVIDYIALNNIQNIVVGASNRNAITRKFRNPDVPSNLVKSAPDFCAVYIIAKGKPMTVRSAKSGSSINAVPPRQTTIHSVHPAHPIQNQDDTIKAIRGENWRGQYNPSPQTERRSFERYADNRTTNRERNPVRGPNNAFLDSLDSTARPSISRYSDFNDSFSDDTASMGRQSIDFGDSPEYSLNSMDPPLGNSPSPNSYRDIEAEMKRLRLELKQTMDMYSTACKEAITAKQKAKELNQWKVDEARKYQQLRNAEEAALAIAEMEKAKCQAALEAAGAAQRIAEIEAQKRMNAEKKAKREAEEKKKALAALANNDIRYRKYSIEEIEVATDRFDESLKIGEGGYGPVYKACLDHTPVAIKVLRPDAAQGRKQFNQEVEVLSCIRHPNMVLLLGACPEYGCLVYEYMDNGSLEDRLYRRGNTPSIPWSVRFKIAAEIATGLLFLHQAKPEPLVHRDLKPANILLDRNYTSKISDVGLARLVPPSVADTVTQYHMTSTAGTFCYIDPEYQQTGMLGTKSDIYSLGIMLLQIITAKSPMGLTHHVERAIEKGKFHEMLDQTVTDWPMEDTLSFAELALKCAELRRKDRPDLGRVILPELNRLRNLGHSYEASANAMISSITTASSNSNLSNTTNSSNGSFGAVSSNSNSNSNSNLSSNFSNPIQRPRSLVQQERPTSNPGLRAPWMSTSDA